MGGGGRLRVTHDASRVVDDVDGVDEVDTDEQQQAGLFSAYASRFTRYAFRITHSSCKWKGEGMGVAIRSCVR